MYICCWPLFVPESRFININSPVSSSIERYTCILIYSPPVPCHSQLNMQSAATSTRSIHQNKLQFSSAVHAFPFIIIRRPKKVCYGAYPAALDLWTDSRAALQLTGLCPVVVCCLRIDRFRFIYVVPGMVQVLKKKRQTSKSRNKNRLQ